MPKKKQKNKNTQTEKGKNENKKENMWCQAQKALFKTFNTFSCVANNTAVSTFDIYNRSRNFISKISKYLTSTFGS